MTHVTVFGLQRSGTNYVEQLLLRNVKKSAVLNGGNATPREAYIGNNFKGLWKHGYNFSSSDFKKLFKHKFKIFYVYKHPYRWIESVLRKGQDFHDDVIKVNPSIFSSKKKSFVEQCAVLYVDHMRYWREVCAKYDFMRIYYKNLLDHEQEFLASAASLYDLSLTKTYHPPLNVIPKSSPMTKARWNYYKQGKIHHLTFEDIMTINNVLDSTSLLSESLLPRIRTLAEYEEKKIASVE